MSKYLTPRFLVVYWIGGFFSSGIVQSIFQTEFASITYWGINIGWQNEIAIWNLGMLGVLIGVLTANSRIESRVLPGLAILSGCFAINHAAAILSSPSSIGNWAGALSNALIVLLFIAHYFTPKINPD